MAEKNRPGRQDRPRSNPLAAARRRAAPGFSRRFDQRIYHLLPATYSTESQARERARVLRGTPWITFYSDSVRSSSTQPLNARVVKLAGGWRIYVAPSMKNQRVATAAENQAWARRQLRSDPRGARKMVRETIGYDPTGRSRVRGTRTLDFIRSASVLRHWAATDRTMAQNAWEKALREAGEDGRTHPTKAQERWVDEVEQRAAMRELLAQGLEDQSSWTLELE